MAKKVTVPASHNPNPQVCWEQWHGTTPSLTVDMLEHCTRPSGHLGPHTWENPVAHERQRLTRAFHDHDIDLNRDHTRLALLELYAEACMVADRKRSQKQ